MNKTLWLGGLVLIIVIALGVYAWRVQAPSAVPVVTMTTTPASNATPAGSTAINQPVQHIPNSTPAASGGTTAQQGATISITDTGFEPNTVTVTAGTTVTFMNNGQSPHWPASNPHPTHTDLPGFDAKHPLQPGDTYSFTFTKVGTWGFHDHLDTSHTGQVIVQ